MISKFDEHPVRCPHCGNRFGIPIQRIEKKIYGIIRSEAKIWGVAKTSVIAKRISLSNDQTLRYLQKMENKGMIYRIGTRSGWRIVE